MKLTGTFAKFFSSVSTLGVVVGALTLNGLAMGQSGTVAVWGFNFYGECNIPVAAQSGVTAISSGSIHTIVLKDGGVIAWGLNDNGQCNISTAGQSGVNAIAGCYYNTIALKSGAVLVWGSNTWGQCDIPTYASSGVSAIAGGTNHIIALKSSAVFAWGYNGQGQCTIPTDAQYGVTAIAGGTSNTIALKNGAVLAWGDNNYRQCIIPSDAQSGVTAIAGVGNHITALKGGAVFAWGDNQYGQCLGTNSSGNPLISSTAGGGPVQINGVTLSDVTAIANGYYHTVALKNGGVLAWGNNGQGQCTIPAAALSGVTDIAGGVINTIALKKSPTTITGVLPISGPSSGNTNITITGTNFEAFATVTIGGAPATNVVVVSDTQITATTPAGFPGPAVVTVNLGSSTAFYYRPTCSSDVDNNGVVDNADLGIMLLDYGSCSESAAATEPVEPVQIPMIEQPKPLAAKK